MLVQAFDMFSVVYLSSDEYRNNLFFEIHF